MYYCYFKSVASANLSFMRSFLTNSYSCCRFGTMKNETIECTLELMTGSLIHSPGEKMHNSTQHGRALATIDSNMPLPTIPRMMLPNEVPPESSYALFGHHEVMHRLLRRICRVIIGLHYSVRFLLTATARKYSWTARFCPDDEAG